jgi:murein DD-endopeptidase MepM/ murein hydrolase activator NlpD
MSHFARGIVSGARVRQGQLIGYVGSTGLAAGTHVHYEVLVHGRFVDPLRIRLPPQRVLGGAMLARFDRRRAQLDEAASREGQLHRLIVDKL